MKEIPTKFLPLGSIVKVEESNVPIIIVGYLTKKENQESRSDYLGCPYPLGFMIPNGNIVFNHKSILELISLGYSSDISKRLNDEMLNIDTNGTIDLFKIYNINNKGDKIEIVDL